MITIPLTISWVKEFTCVTSMPFVRTAMTNTPRNVRCGPPTPPDRAVPHDAGRDCIEQESASRRWSSGAHLAREHDTSQATNRAGNDKSNDLIGCDGPSAPRAPRYRPILVRNAIAVKNTVASTAASVEKFNFQAACNDKIS
jgi:hypothetical protein